ncbi:MAG: hypothetical protein ABI587_08660 [Gemmatimonadales bacterium]
MRPLRLLLLTLALVSCTEPKQEASISETIPNLPLPPDAELLSREGGEDALKLHFRSATPPEVVVSYYRGVLSRPPWTLVSDVKTGDGGIAMYAEQAGPSLWVTVRKADGASGSLVDIAGAKSAR